MKTKPATKEEFDAFISTFTRKLEADYSMIGEPPMTNYYDWTIRPEGIRSLSDLAACRVASICHEYEVDLDGHTVTREWKTYRILDDTDAGT